MRAIVIVLTLMVYIILAKLAWPSEGAFIMADQDISLLEKSLIQKHEGFRSRVYKDTLGNRTIGFGFNLEDPTVNKLVPKEVAQGERLLTTKEAAKAFNSLFSRAEKNAKQFAGQKTFENLNPARRYVLKDMAYNMGLSRLKSFKKFKAALAEGNFEAAADEMIDSNWYRQVGNRGKFLENLMRKGGQ
jgi:lysozyme